MELIQEFSLSKKVANQSFIMGSIMLLGGVMLFFLLGNLTLIGLGIFLLVIGGLNQNLKIVKVYPQYLEIKLGVIASKKFVKYDQITQFKIANKLLLIHYNNDEKKPKKVKIATRALAQEDIITLNEVLLKKTDLDASNSLITTVIK
ncbi:hypothetical protein M0D21_15740 [Aquimarina sp. D1M17]|uniref:hypothetical protein n=1 Tax=Aquimarina acroporae TaxID=2937283 RepID=UPI0020BF791F|nr:hypothetical protein [Aquimarina acroporae]MCK8523030.1 hypothetical protein [Aquimarina acroporae]